MYTTGKRFLTYSLASTAIGLLFAVVATTFITPSASALSGSEFQAGRIIDDAIFYAPNTLTVQQIQDFLNAKVPVCDTNGTQMRGSVTRAQYGASVGNPAPYTCLKNFRQDTVAKTAEAGLCNGYGVANQSAADIIYNVAQSCGINSKVLLVLLQKEQALITDDWPWPTQYRSATGYGCPDTAACDSQYYGFFNQVYSAARGFKYYAKYSNSFNYLAGRNNNILYSPAAGCGSSTILIQNQATAGLYNYTPYQPNAAALNNLYGTGDGCSAYGNRNFWRLFNDWFGSTSDNIPISYTIRLVSPITASPATPVAGEPVTISYTVQNFGSQPANYQSSIIQCRLGSIICGAPYDSPTSIAAGEQRTFTQTLTSLQTGGTYTLTPYFLQNDVWSRYGTDTANGSSLQLDIPGMRLVSPITLTPATPVAGEPVTVSYTVKNMGVKPVSYQTSVLQCTLNTTTSCDPPMNNPITFAPDEQRTFYATVSSLQPGSYSLTPYFLYNGSWYKYGLWGVDANTLPLTLPDIRLVGNINSSPAIPVPNQPTTFSYTVKNFGSSSITYQTSILQCRFYTYENCDPPTDAPITLAAGEQRTLTVTKTNLRDGQYTFTPYYMINDRWYKYGKGTADSTSYNLNVPAYLADMRLLGDISISPTQPIPGQPVVVSYTVKNFGTQPAYYQTSILQCLINNNMHCDPAHDAPVTIAAGDQYTFTINFPAVKAGSYSFTPYFVQNYDYHPYAKGTASGTTLRVDIPAYVADMRLMGPITLSPSQPTPGQTVTVTYTAKNFGSQPAIFQSSILQCRRFTYINCDPALDAPLTIAAGAQHTFTATLPTLPSGYYIFTPYFLQNDTWYRFNSGVAPASNKETTF